jgi:hypothetical protein
MVLIARALERLLAPLLPSRPQAPPLSHDTDLELLFFLLLLFWLLLLLLLLLFVVSPVSSSYAHSLFKQPMCPAVKW